MPPLEVLILVGAAALGGALNAVAGGGSFFTFPALVFTGVPSVAANATSTLALWPGSLASAIAYRKDFATDRRETLMLAGTSVVGGTLGALLLVRTPDHAFDHILPFLLLVATALFAAGPRITARLSRSRGDGHGRALPLSVGVLVQLGIAVYGGYFGGGMGMMMLAAFSLLGMTDIHRMNGFKAMLAVFINAIAIVTFVLADVLAWREGLLMAVGAAAGGYGGAWLARRVEPGKVRLFIIAVGTVMTGVFLVRAYG